MDRGERGYRSARPDERTFVFGGAARHLAVGIAVLGGGLSVLAGPKLLWPIGGTAAAVSLARLLDGAPTRLVVRGDDAVLHRLLRPARSFALSATVVQLLPEELVLATPAGTFEVPRSRFSSGELDACVALLRQACSRFVERVDRSR